MLWEFSQVRGITGCFLLSSTSKHCVYAMYICIKCSGCIVTVYDMHAIYVCIDPR